MPFVVRANKSFSARAFTTVDYCQKPSNFPNYSKFADPRFATTPTTNRGPKHLVLFAFLTLLAAANVPQVVGSRGPTFDAYLFLLKMGLIICL